MRERVLESFDFADNLINPAVAITWSTEGVFNDPVETFGAGSGYFLDPEHVVTAGHVPAMVSKDAERMGVVRRRGVPSHFMDVHDPRSDLHWYVYSVAELAYEGAQSEFTVLSVAPRFFDNDSVQRYAKWREGFIVPPHRPSPMQTGQAVKLRGFTDINATLDSGGTSVEVNGRGCLATGVVKEIHPNGFLLVKNPCVTVGGPLMPGNTSGGPVFDDEDNIVGIISASGIYDDATVVSTWSTILPPVKDPTQISLLLGDIAARLYLV